MANYLEDRDLYYQVVLSKGKGELTKKTEMFFLLIAEHMIQKFESRYHCSADRDDCYQQGLM